MADLTKLISFGNLSAYDTLIKKYIDDADAVVDAKSIKTVLWDATTEEIKFFKKQGATLEDTPEYKVAVSSSDITTLKSQMEEVQGTLTGYSSTSTVATAVAAAEKNAKDHADAEIKKLAEGAVAANTTAIDAINNSETGILKQAKDYTDALANGQVKTNKEAIESINDTTTGILATAKKYTDDEIDKVEATIGTIPASAEAETVIGYVDEQVAKATGDASQVAADLAAYKTTNDAAVAANKTAIESEVTRATGAEEALGGRIDDVEDLIGEVEEGKTVMGVVAENLTAANSYTDTEIGKLGSVLNFKGTVATVSALPTEGVKVGDVYHVTEKSAEYVYVTGGTWEELGSVVDLSAYETIEGAEGKIATAKSEAITAAETYADGLDEAMDARVKVVEAAIGEGGSVQSQIDASIALLDSSATLAEGEDYLTGVTITDGKITAHTAGVFNFDEAGAAEAVRTEFEPYKYTIATSDDINGLFSKPEQA